MGENDGMSIKAYWECDKCGYYINIEHPEDYFYVENALDKLTAKCENPNCNGVMRLKVILNE